MKLRLSGVRMTVAPAGIAAILVFGAIAFVQASFLESDYPPPGRPPEIVPPRPPPPLPPRPIPPPKPQNEVTALLDDLAIYPATTYRGLTIFPLGLQRGQERRSYQTLDEGLANGTVTVREREGGVVSELVVANASDTHTFLLAGELILGGKQNRFMRSDVLLPPKSGDVVIPVYCGEKGRWTGRGGFETKQSLAPSRLRQGAMGGAAQSEIWNGIREDADRLNAASPTESLQEIYETPAVRDALREYRQQCGVIFRDQPAVGFVVARFGRIVGAEVFRSRSLFQRLQGKLIDSYAIDCIGMAETAYRGDRPTIMPSVVQAKAFLERAYRATYAEQTTPGAGRLLVLSGITTGQALTFDGGVVHLSQYQRVVIVRPLPPRPPRPIPMR